MTGAIKTWVVVDFLIFGHEWTATTEVSFTDFDTATVFFEDTFGKKDGRLVWFRDADMRERVPRVELERIEEMCVERAREQLNSAAMRRRMQRG